mgnify:CR=1 FL=1|tara:strand:- start:5571 stop:5876 length:306 start_codon:yes stop_codon:yes gene_type:complete
MHALSLGTWFIHIATIFEWTLAIMLISLIARRNQNNSLNWLAIAMLPNLISAMAAITWHIFDNNDSLYGLVVLQSIMTVFGNTAMAFAAFNIYQLEREKTC